MSALTTLLNDLVSIDSVNPALAPAHPGEGGIARFVFDWATERALEVAWLESTPGRPSVIVTARGSGGGRSLMLNAHLDTVGVAGMDAPFTPRREGGRLFGRGALDMKASLAACLLCVAHAASANLAGDVILTAVADEEHGSIGTREALAALLPDARVDAAIVTEPSGLDLHVAHRGFALFELELHGRASHTSQPQLGVNALTHLGRLLAAVERLDDGLRNRPPHPLLNHSSLQPVLASGGHELFTTPNLASVTLERRTLPGETEAAARAELQALLDSLAREDPAFVATVRTTVEREPFEAPPGSEIEQLLVAAVAAENAAARWDGGGAEPALLGAPYWTDAALVAAEGIPTVLFGPSGGGIHQPDEWVDLASAMVVLRVLERVAVEFCGRALVI